MKYTAEQNAAVEKIMQERGIGRKAAMQRYRKQQQQTTPASSSAQTAEPVTAA